MTKKQNPKIKNLRNSASLNYNTSSYLREDVLEEPQNFFRANISDSGQKEDTLNYVHFLDQQDSLLKKMHIAIENSYTLKSVLLKKDNFVFGGGLTAFPLQKSMLSNTLLSDDSINEKQVNLLDDFLLNVNPKGENIYDVCNPIVSDYNNFGNGYLEIHKTNSKISIYYRPFHEVRMKEVSDRSKDKQYCLVSRDFDGAMAYTYPRVVMPLFPNFEIIDGVEKCILHIKNNFSGFDYYGLPNWISAIIWAEMQYRVAKYQQSEFDNGFMPSALLQVFGNANDEQLQDQIDELVEDQTGTGNQAQLMALMLGNGSEPAQVDILSKQREGSYLEVLKVAERAIMQSESFSDALMGNKTPGELGGSQQLRTELEYKYEELFKPIQDFLSKKLLQPIIDLFFETKKMSSEIKLCYNKNIPITFVGDISVSDLMTTNEKREIIGLPPIEKEIDNGNQ